MWFLSGVGNVPTPNVCSDVWDCVESYTIRMLLACRLKIISTSNLKLILSFLVLHIVLISLFKSLSLVASTRHAHLTLLINLRLANWPSAGAGQRSFRLSGTELLTPPPRMTWLTVTMARAVTGLLTGLHVATVQSLAEVFGMVLPQCAALGGC
jgi:hypothetical protein